MGWKPYFMEDAPTFGSWLKQRRKGFHLTQKELAREVGYAEVTLRKVEANELRPSRELVQRLTEALRFRWQIAHRSCVLPGLKSAGCRLNKRYPVIPCDPQQRPQP